MEKRLGDSINEWLRLYKRNSVKEATYDRLRISLGLLERDEIADYLPSELRCNDIQSYLNRLVQQGYSESTVKKQYTLLTAFLKHQAAIGESKNLVYLGVSLPKTLDSHTDGRAIDIYSDVEQVRLKRVLSRVDHIAYLAVILMMEAGLRIGEALALEWTDILWSRRAVRINKTLVRLSDQNGLTFVQNSAKTKTSNRIVPLSAYAMDILRRVAPDDCRGYIFSDCKDDDIPMSYATTQYHVRKACDEADVEYKGMHAFRHTFATNCYHKGCDVKILSKLLGHAKVSITYDIYIHLYGDALEEMRSVID